MSASPRFHVALNASRGRFDDSVVFYEKVFGAAPAKRKPGYAKFDLQVPPINLTLNAVDGVARSDLNHLGIQVWSDDELDDARGRLTAAGLSLEEQQGIECCYAKQNKFWLTDPDGRKLELFYVRHDIEQDGRRAPRSLKMMAGDAAAGDAACCAPGSDCK